MKAHLLQMELAWEEKGANFEKVEGLAGCLLYERGDLIVLPEMFDTGFSLALEKTADTGGETLEFLRGLSKRLGVFVQGSRTVIGGDGRGRNLATVVGPTGEVVCEYAKVHPFSFGREGERFSGGEDVKVYRWDGVTRHAGVLEGGGVEGGAEASGARSWVTVCPAVCYDLRFPELFRRGMMMGAEVFALGANWPSARAGHWRALLVARAIENQGYVLGVNRTGSDPHLRYSGGTMAVGPKGEVLGEMGEEEGVLSVEVERRAVEHWRRAFPAVKDVKLM